MESSGKNLIIVGAGISGLVCGVYAQRSGWNTIMLEKALNPGGVSTSWVRKGYTFEGGIHWLIGAKEGVPLHDIWTESGALQANNPISFRDPIYTIIDGDRKAELHRDLKTLSKIDRRDRFALALLRFHVWCFTFFHSPVQDIAGVKARHPRGFSLMEFIKMGPAVILTPWLMAFSAGTYCRRFRDPLVRNLLETVVDPRINALSLIYTLSSFTSGDSGYPKGGSLVMAQNMADTFTSLGGEIRYRTTVLEVVREGERYVGVRTSEGLLRADAIVISADARTAIDKLFAEPLQDGWARRMRRKMETAQCMFVAIGVKADLSSRPRCARLMLREPLHAGGLVFDAITVNNYSGYEGYAPEGCTPVTAILPGACYDYWKAAKENGNYYELKKEVIAAFVRVVSEFYPETAGNVEVTDMATPMTYQRYCDTFEGSYMSDWRPWRFASTAPICYKPGLYFTGQRTAFSGGLPVAAETGRRTAQHLCKDHDIEFVSH